VVTRSRLKSDPCSGSVTRTPQMSLECVKTQSALLDNPTLPEFLYRSRGGHRAQQPAPLHPPAEAHRRCTTPRSLESPTPPLHGHSFCSIRAGLARSPPPAMTAPGDRRLSTPASSAVSPATTPEPVPATTPTGLRPWNKQREPRGTARSWPGTQGEAPWGVNPAKH
jgi:hypothetical protein